MISRSDGIVAATGRSAAHSDVLRRRGHRRPACRLPGEVRRRRHSIPVRHRRRLLPQPGLRDRLQHKQRRLGAHPRRRQRHHPGAESDGVPTAGGEGDAAGGVQVLQLQRQRHRAVLRRRGAEQDRRVPHLRRAQQVRRPGMQHRGMEQARGQRGKRPLHKPLLRRLRHLLQRLAERQGRQVRRRRLLPRRHPAGAHRQRRHLPAMAARRTGGLQPLRLRLPRRQGRVPIPEVRSQDGPETEDAGVAGLGHPRPPRQHHLRGVLPGAGGGDVEEEYASWIRVRERQQQVRQLHQWPRILLQLQQWLRG